MSIASELNNLEGNIEDSYDAVNDMGGIIPAQRNMDNLDQAIRTIPQSQGTTYTAGYGIDIDQNDEISVDTSVIAEKTDIPTNTSDLTNDGSDGTSTYVEADDLATVATSGDYGDLLNTPTIPTNTSDLTNDGDDGVHPFLATDDVATVATSGLYSDLTGTPTIPTNTSDLVNDGADGTSTYVEADDLATVATSGLYSDLTGTPTIPTVNDATLTIQHNGTNVQTFTANQATNATANIETIWADDIEATTPVPSVETAMIADGAVTSAKIDWSTVAIETGRSELLTIPNNGSVDKAFTFTKPFTTPPVVMVTMRGDASWVEPTGELLAVVTDNITTTGFTARLFNPYSGTATARQMYVDYIAIGV